MMRRVMLLSGVVATMVLVSAPVATAQFSFLSGAPGFSFTATNEDGSPAVQAGAHPYAMSVAFEFSSLTNSEGFQTPEADVKDVEVGLPAGMVVNPTATPTLCTEEQLLDNFGSDPNREECPLSSQVGVAIVHLTGFAPIEDPLYNMVPPAGEPAEFGFVVEGTTAIHILPDIRTGSDSGISSITPGLAQNYILGSNIVIWGNPSEESHDSQRGVCDDQISQEHGTLCPIQRSRKSLLTMPTSCSGRLVSTISADSWQQPGDFIEDRSEAPGMTGCNKLSLAPSFSAAPDTARADSPAGLTFDLKTPQDGLLDNRAIAAPDLKTTTVTLPEGVAVNPGQAAGLVACQPGEDGIGTTSAPSCPNASKVGTVEITTPLLDKNFYGNVYILPSNPPELKLLVAASAEGINLKLVGAVHLNEQTGQLVTVFEDTPQLPFDEFKLSFSGGAQAALTTPVRCGAYTTTGDFTPWSSPEAPDAVAQSTFAVTSSSGGASCPGSGALPYTPTMVAGATTDQAGGYTDFSLLLQVPDDQQRTSRLQFKTPEGLLGMISKIPLCTNAQAEANACPAASQIGHTTVASGPGPYPLVIPQPGQAPAPIFLTEGYEGAPYGLSIEVPIHVGPFTLPTQRVRARIEVDPLTAQLTVTTDALPQYVAGVPTDLRTIDAVIDRPGFMFNPTGCDAQAFSGTAFGSEGAQAPIESHFQMGSCRALSFKPNFKAFTSGKTSRADGASLGVKIVYPSGELGANQASSQSNIKSVKVELPKKLPSRLTTLQKACTAAQFDANPAGCPAASVVGHATAVTPVLPVPLSGPAYFVSNGNESFPNLIVVLQGYGVTVHLVGDTFISKKGITSSTFKSVPDVPIASFELNLPEGPYSALAANGNLCKAKLAMPTRFVAQNGAELQQNTPITTTGCPKAKKATHKKKATHRKAKRAPRNTSR
jgi:hypothetical protein